MALNPCPHCGKEISSLAKRCPSCGTELIQTPAPATKEAVCPECGTHFEQCAASCPNCGEPNPLLSASTPADIPAQNIVVDYDKIFNTDMDEFEDTKRIFSAYWMSGNPELDKLSEEVGALKPFIDLGHITRGDGASFCIRYDEHYVFEKLRDNGTEDMQGLGTPCKGLIINVDGTETIKLNAVYSNEGLSAFQIEQSQFLRCCNAHDLVFKVFRKNGTPIVIHGTKEDEELLIASFQAMYSYIVDNTMFPHAASKVQQWYDKTMATIEKERLREEQLLHEKERELHEIELERENKKKKEIETLREKGKTKQLIGVLLIVVGFILFISLGSVDDESGILVILVLAALSCLAVGIVLIFIGMANKNGIKGTLKGGEDITDLD